MGSTSSRYASPLNIKDLMYKDILIVEFEIIVSMCSNYIDYQSINVINVR